MMKLDEVMPGLYIRAKIESSQVRDVIAGDFHVVSLIANPDLRIVDAIGKKYHHHPMKDGYLDNLLLARANRAAEQTADLLSEGEKVIVHCWSGKNRAGLVCALAYRALMGGTGMAAIQAVREARPPTLTNRHFVEYLEGLD